MHRYGCVDCTRATRCCHARCMQTWTGGDARRYSCTYGSRWLAERRDDGLGAQAADETSERAVLHWADVDAWRCGGVARSEGQAHATAQRQLSARPFWRMQASHAGVHRVHEGARASILSCSRSGCVEQVVRVALQISGGNSSQCRELSKKYLNCRMTKCGVASSASRDASLSHRIARRR